MVRHGCATEQQERDSPGQSFAVNNSYDVMMVGSANSISRVELPRRVICYGRKRLCSTSPGGAELGEDSVQGVVSSTGPAGPQDVKDVGTTTCNQRIMRTTQRE